MNRKVVIGAAGFVGSAIATQLEEMNHKVVRVTRSDIDLAEIGASAKLSQIISEGDTVVFAAADAPCKSTVQYLTNIQMICGLIDAVSGVQLEKLVYISSDAVYSDSRQPLNEESLAIPESLHGVMHRSREMLLTTTQHPLLVLRPTLIYGPADPHNGYGPNRFARAAKAGSEVVLFGNGEEMRDHVHISDVAYYAACAIVSDTGVVNIASGELRSFVEIATTAVALGGGSSRIRTQPRQGAMPHGGYRAFDIARLRDKFKSKPMILLEHALEKEFHLYGS